MWSVHRQADGEVMESGFPSEEEAEAWARENLPEQAPQKWWYVDQEAR